MEARAILRYARVTPRKVRLAVDLIRGKRVEEAINILKLLPLHVAPVLGKVVHSAVANAEQKKIGDIDTLRVAEAFVDQGPAFKRFKAGPMGRGMPRKKFTSHITIILKSEGDAMSKHGSSKQG
jgi:large subunit ribosomal protein L22